MIIIMSIRSILAIYLLFLFPLYLYVNVAYANIDVEIAESHKCSRMFPYFEKVHKIPPNTLHSIALKESGKKHTEYKIKVVWPWTVNVEGKGYYFNTKKEATSFVKKQIIQGKENIDVGCMQINLKHHLNAFNSLNQAFDPKKNVAYAAKFLKAKYDQLGSWHKAIAHYHSATHEFGSKYKQDVIKIANNMDLYKNSINMYSGYNYYNNTPPLPTNMLLRNKQRASFESNIRKYKSNIMVVLPRAS
ncbi:lytic transglycosylase domain-containing protein [Candidatus Tisiphia endosymbiont of Dascillus cervinus]|uniref:lytic transglycosylase domain-containing protein n=1 Tax=Candidatus Tisiphia endosymbiont of Dascillus cervinus TaxID=3066253 RepID=UPI00312CB7B6